MKLVPSGELALDYVDEQAQRLISRAQAKGADEVEVDVSCEYGFSVSARLGKLEKLEQHNEQGLTLTIYKNHCLGCVSVTDFSLMSLNAALDKALSLASFTQQDTCQALADSSELAFGYPDLALDYRWRLSPDQAIETAIAMDLAACEEDARIIHVDGSEVETMRTQCYYANSHGFVGHYPYTRHSVSCAVVAENTSGKQQYGDYDIHCRADKLVDAVQLAKQVAQKACARLSPRKIPTGECPIVFEAPVARSILACFLRAIDGYTVYRQASFLQQARGQLVFPDFFSLYQRPHVVGELSCAPFDDEGVRTRDFDILQAGRFEHFLCDSYTARKLGVSTTGNAGGVFNMHTQPSTQTLPDLLKTMGTGLLVTEMMGQGVNMVTGDYSRGANGFWIEGGEIQFPVDEITVAGQLQQMFLRIVAVGNDIDHRSSIKTGSILIEGMMVAGT